MNNQTVNENIEINLLDIVKLLWRKVWIIILCMIVCGATAFFSAIFFIAPQYTARAMMYVNNNSLSVGSTTFTFSSSQLSAAKSLLDVYVIILQSRTTLEAVIEEAELDYTYEQLSGMVTASAVNNTEIFSITATCGDPAEAELIVDTIVEILPDRISDIVDGSSVRLVDHAIRPVTRSSPSYTKHGVIGILIGAVLSCAAIIIQDLLNTTVRDEDYLKQRYNIPVLAIVPDAYGGKNGYGYKSKYKYKYGYHRYGYGYYKRSYEKSYENAKAKEDSKK